MLNDHHFTLEGGREWARRAVDSLEAKQFFPSDITGIFEKSASAQAHGAGKAVVSYGRGGARVSIDYRPVSGGEAVLSIFNCEGKRLVRQRMAGGCGVLSAVFDNSAGTAIKNSRAALLRRSMR